MTVYLVCLRYVCCGWTIIFCWYIDTHTDISSYTGEWCVPMGWYIFLHDRPWKPPWINSISNQLDITIHIIASQLSSHCDVISNRLWHYQLGRKPNEWNTGSMCKDRRVIAVMSCKKWNNICMLVTNCLWAHSSDILVFISLAASQLGK